MAPCYGVATNERGTPVLTLIMIVVLLPVCFVLGGGYKPAKADKRSSRTVHATVGATRRKVTPGHKPMAVKVMAHRD